jgi:Pentapeptide repeats (9 copies)
MSKQKNTASDLESTKSKTIELIPYIQLFLLTTLVCVPALIICTFLLPPIKFFQPRWENLGKHGRKPFLALLTFFLVLIFHDLMFPPFILFFIEKASSQQAIAILGIFALILICLLAVVSYCLVISIQYFSQASIKFEKLFNDKINEPFHQDKDRTDHSFRTVDAILKYFGVLATFIASIGFMANYFNSQQTAKIDREKMLNELSFKAIEQLGFQSVDVNLAGIYSLEKSAINSPNNQWKVVSILANYIKQHPPILNEEMLLKTLITEYKDKYKYKEIDEKVKKDLLENEKYETKKNRGRSLAPYKKIDIRVQAALGVICRRKLENDKDLFESIQDKYHEITKDEESYSTIISNRIIDLSTTRDRSTVVSDLSNYDMSGCNFHRVALNRATLHNANMTNADLSKGYLIDSSLIKSNLIKADLEKSDLTIANLSSAFLNKAKMKQTNLTMTNLTGANLSGAYDLNKDQIREACYWKKATYSHQQTIDLDIYNDTASSDREECKKKWLKG